MGDSLEVRTVYAELADAVREFATRVDEDWVRLPSNREIPEGDWVSFSVKLADGTSFLEGLGRCRSTTRRGNGSFDVSLSMLQFDARNEVMYERMMLARESLAGGDDTGTFDLRGMQTEITRADALPSMPEPSRAERSPPPLARSEDPKPANASGTPRSVPPPPPSGASRPKTTAPPRPPAKPPTAPARGAPPPASRATTTPATPSEATAKPRSGPPPAVLPARHAAPMPAQAAAAPLKPAKTDPAPRPSARRNSQPAIRAVTAATIQASAEVAKTTVTGTPTTAAPTRSDGTGPAAATRPAATPGASAPTMKSAAPAPATSPAARAVASNPRVTPTAGDTRISTAAAPTLQPSPTSTLPGYATAPSEPLPDDPTMIARKAPPRARRRRNSLRVPIDDALPVDTVVSRTEDMDLLGLIERAIKLEVPAHLVERARALADALPASVIEPLPNSRGPEEAVLRTALRLGLASLAALAEDDDR